MNDAIFSADWDVIVIGTGIGGATAGRVLAEAGHRVLFVEQGAPGHRAEETPLDLDMADPVARRLRGFWPDPVRARVDGRDLEFHAPLGAGPGGSSVFYAATLERPAPHDLDHSPARPHPTGGWPVRYGEMAPFLDRATAMYHLSGTPDPLSGEENPALAPAPPPAPGDAALMARLTANGLHPYQLHAAIRHLPGCTECLGRKCPRACKMDARSAGLDPALATGNAALVTDCEVTMIHADTAITHVDVIHAGTPRRLNARAYLLAAGALASPRLLLASANAAWPDGLANGSGQVGRNLMFHLNEMLAVWPRRAAQFDGPSKAIGFRDLYWLDGARGGMVQAMGIEAGYGEILHFLRLALARSPLWSRLPGGHELARLPAALAARLFGNAKLFVGIVEDLPDPGNRVLLDQSDPRRLRFTYDIPAELGARRRAFRRAMRHAFRGQRRVFLGRLPEPNYGHPCGTLRMGDDPGASVVNADGRAHALANLWVADASVFPTSMGVNPSLTIAANAIRVAEILGKRLETAP